MKFFAANIVLFSISNIAFAKEYKALRQRKLIQKMPCLMIEKVVNSREPLLPTWECEMDEDESLPGGKVILPIEGLTSDDITNNEIKSGRSTLLAENAEITGGVLRITKGDRMKFGRIQNRGRGHKQNRNLSTQEPRNVLAVRVKASDSKTTSTATEISNAIFGTNGNDDTNLVSQFDACSYGKMTFAPATGDNIVDGVTEVSIDLSVDEASPHVIKNAVLNAATDLLGDLPSQFDHVMLCIPPNTENGEKWYGYAYLNHWLSVYNDDYCNYANIQLHEIGHNLNMQHRTDQDVSDEDQTGIMGPIDENNEGLKMCFNPGQSWNLGWYNNRHAIANPLETSWNGILVGITDYDSTTDHETVLLKIPNGITDYYLGFNRASGINSGTQAAINQVTLFEQSGFGPSTLVAVLDAGDSFNIPNYRWSLQDITIDVSAIDLSHNIPYAHVQVYKAECFPGSCEPGCESTSCCTVDSDCESEFACVAGTCNSGMCLYDTSACETSVLQMEITTDNNPDELRWEVTDDCNNGVVVMSGGSYLLANKEYDPQQVSVNPSRFTVTVYGSGEKFEGNFRATLDGVEILSGGEFYDFISAKYGTCDGSPPSPPELSLDYEQIISEDFEDRKNFFIDAGPNAFVASNKAHTGTKSLCIKDNSRTSLVDSSFDVAPYISVRLNFWFTAANMDVNEGFAFEYSSDDGTTWTSIFYEVGTDFENGDGWYEAAEEFDVVGIDTIMIRFRSSVNLANERICIDDVMMSGKGPLYRRGRSYGS